MAIGFAFSHISYKGKPTACTHLFVWLLSVTTIIFIFTHSTVCTHGLLRSSPLYGYITMCLSTHLLLDISVVCWLFLLFVGLGYYKKSSSEYSRIGVLCGHMFASLLGKYLAAQWLSHMLCECTFNFLRNCLTLFQSSSTVLHSHRLWRRLLVVHIFKNTCIFRIFLKFNFSLSRMCNDCSLWLTCAFPQWLMVSHTLLSHLCTFFGEPRLDLCPIITGLLSLLLMNYESSLYRLDTNPLFHIW